MVSLRCGTVQSRLGLGKFLKYLPDCFANEISGIRGIGISERLAGPSAPDATVSTCVEHHYR